MHLGYNISKDLMEIFKGENRHLSRIPGYWDEDIVISEEGWIAVDAELVALGKGTSQGAFGSRPRDTSKYKSWKAAEYRQFVMNYWIVLLDGRLPRRIMGGLRLFSSVVELWSRPSLRLQDLEDMDRLAVSFFKHFEREYFRYEERRVGLCKLTMHMLLHLKENVQRCGPLVNCNQFWVERFIEFTKSRLNGRAKAGESMTQDALLLEAYKLFYNEHFVIDEFSVDNEGYGVVSMQYPCRLQILSSPRYGRWRLLELLRSYIAEAEGLDDRTAAEAVQNDMFLSFGGAKICCGQTWQAVGSSMSGRKKSPASRSNFYIAAQYPLQSDDSSESSSTPQQAAVYYGGVQMFMEYTFKIGGLEITRKLYLADWATNLRVTELEQVYHDSSVDRMFTGATVGDISAICNLIGVLEHAYPTTANYAPRRGKKTFLLDPHREVNYLLDASRLSPDGINRTLGGLSRSAARR